LRLRFTTVEHFDGAAFTTAIRGVGGANGINISGGWRLSMCRVPRRARGPDLLPRSATDAVTLRSVLDVPGFADNIDVEGNGDLLLGCTRRSLPSLAMWVMVETVPDQIMRLKPDGKAGSPGTPFTIATGRTSRVPVSVPAFPAAC
jgi:hypothetical protein